MQKTKERGDFMPIAMSPFAYNNSRAQERFPLTKEQAEKLKYPRHKKDYSPYDGP